MKWIQTKDRLPTHADAEPYDVVLVRGLTPASRPMVRLLPYNLVHEPLDTHWASIDPPDSALNP